MTESVRVETAARRSPPDAGGPRQHSASPTHDPGSAAHGRAEPTCPPGGLPRLLADLAGGRPVSLAEHRRRYAAPPRPGRVGDAHLVETVTNAGLRGRGGAAFPTGTKLAAVAGGRGRPVVVANGTEGEPASRKDRSLLAAAPHLVLDGVALAAAAVGAREAYVAIDRANPAVRATVEAAVAERDRQEPALAVRVVDTPPRYVAGEETALVHFLNGGEAKPTTTPPRPFERGVGRRPTLVANVETLAHIAQIVRNGADWFRETGPADQPGTALVTLSGAVARPAVYEVPLGVQVGDLLASTGGPTAPLQALLFGGYYGAWAAADEACGLAYSATGLAPLGASVGCGAVVALPADACGLAETARVLAWMARETAGQCGPCVHGLQAIAGAAGRLAAGHGDAGTVRDLTRWAGQVEGRGGCRFPDGAVRLLRSALATFAADVEAHLRYGPCFGSRAAPLLPIPRNQEVGWR